MVVAVVAATAFLPPSQGQAHGDADSSVLLPGGRFRVGKAPESQPKEKWSAHLGNEVSNGFISDIASDTSLAFAVVEDGKGGTGEVLAVRLASGDVHWRASLPEDSGSRLAVTEEAIVVNSSNNYSGGTTLQGFAVNNGTRLWSRQFDADARPRRVHPLNGDRVAVELRGEPPTVVVLEAASGGPLLEVPALHWFTDGEFLASIDHSGMLSVLDAHGTSQWQINLGGPSEHGAFFSDEIVVADGGALLRLNAQTGERLGTLDPGVGDLSRVLRVNNKRLLVEGDHGSVVFNAELNRTWGSAMSFRALIASAERSFGVVEEEKLVTVFAVESGERLGEFRLAEGAWLSTTAMAVPLPYTANAFFVQELGRLTAVSLSRAQPLWSIELGDEHRVTQITATGNSILVTYGATLALYE